MPTAFTNCRHRATTRVFLTLALVLNVVSWKCAWLNAVSAMHKRNLPLRRGAAGQNTNDVSSVHKRYFRLQRSAAGQNANDAAVQRRSVTIEERLAGMSKRSPAETLICSPTLRRGAAVVLQLSRTHGDSYVEALMDKAIAQIESGNADWSNLLPNTPDWSAAGLSREEVTTALQQVTKTLNISIDTSYVVDVTARTDFKYTGSLNGQLVEFELAYCDSNAQWGLHSPYVVSTGPSVLLGLRVADVQLSDDSDYEEVSPLLRVQPGDKLYFADEDHTAIREVALHDQLPEMSQHLAPLLAAVSEVSEGDAEATVIMGNEAVSASDIVFEPEVEEAIRFCSHVENIGSEDERASARLRRLCTSQIVKKFQELALQDSEWQEVARILEPRAQRLYVATRNAMLRIRSTNGTFDNRPEVVSLELDLFVIVGFCIVVFAVLFAGWQFFHQPTGDFGSENLPEYTLKGQRTGLTTVPLMYGTPFMPAK